MPPPEPEREDRLSAVRTAAVVVNHNGGDKVLACLAALVELREPPSAIVVVDNASTDDSPDRIAERFPSVRVIALPDNAGPSVARNVGLRAVDADVVLLIDDDVYLRADALDRLLAAQAETGAAVVAPRVVLHPERELVQCDGGAAHPIGTLRLRHGFRPVAELPVERTEVGACIGACLLVDRAAALDAGGFEELFFFYFEDLEFSLRMRSLGCNLVCEPRAVAFHDRGSGTPELSFRGAGGYPARRAYLSHRNRWLCMLIHYRRRTLILLGPLLTLYEAMSLGFFIVNGWPQHWVRAWAWLLSHRREIAARRGPMQARRSRSDAALLEGGTLPLAPNVVRRPELRRAIGAFSRFADGYFASCRGFLR